MQTSQKRIVIVGATGMVGRYALRYALENSAVGSVTSIGRGKVGISEPKLKEVLHRDFADCSALVDTLVGQDAAVFCLGAYTGAVSDADLRRITVDYTIEFARVLHASSPGVAFSFLSGSGADPSGRSRMSFARYIRIGRECATRGGIRSRLSLPARVHLPRGAAEGTKFQLPSFAWGLSGVPAAIPQPGDSGRRLGPGHGGCRRPRNRGASRPGVREPRHPSYCRVTSTSTAVNKSRETNQSNLGKSQEVGGRNDPPAFTALV